MSSDKDKEKFHTGYSSQSAEEAIGKTSYSLGKRSITEPLYELTYLAVSSSQEYQLLRAVVVFIPSLIKEANKWLHLRRDKKRFQLGLPLEFPEKFVTSYYGEADSAFRDSKYSIAERKATLSLQMTPFLIVNGSEYDSYKYKAYLLRGKARFQLKKFKGAIKDFTKVIKFDRYKLYAFRWRGEAKMSSGDYEGAIDDYNHAISMDENDEKLCLARATAKYMLDDFKEAIKDHDKAIELHPNYAQAYNDRGVAKMHLGDDKGAKADLDKAIQVDSKNAKT